MSCKIDGCGNKHYGRGWCKKHYLRWYIYGDPFFTKQHGYSRHPLYKVWGDMKSRCNNQNDTGYKDYGGRGITVCDEWKNSAKAFIEWCLENGWEPGFQIDRRDNDGNYCQENCRFITQNENNHNTRLLRNTNTSGYRGVSWGKRDKRWIAQITINGENKCLGYFDSSRLAAIRYDSEVYKLNDGRPMNFL